MMGICGFAQETDTVKLRITYDVKYKTTENKSLPEEDVMALDIGDTSSHFYSRKAQRQKEIIDSMNATRNINLDYINKATMTLIGGQMYHVYKNMPHKGVLTYTMEILRDAYKTEEAMPSLDWQLEEGDTLICNYDCKKATTVFRGRTWTAWYATDLPFDDGPWKLCGLPGLIMKATEKDNIFSFVCIGIEKGKGEKRVEIVKNKYITCSPEKLNEITNEYFSNMFKFMDKSSSNNDFSESMKSKYPQMLKEKKPCSLEKVNSH
jgi:GLPGLI family protein